MGAYRAEQRVVNSVDKLGVDSRVVYGVKGTVRLALEGKEGGGREDNEERKGESMREEEEKQQKKLLSHR